MHLITRLRLNRIILLVFMATLASPIFAQTTWTVSAGGDLQSVINNAQLGDTIFIAAGATFTGPFTLPAKTGTGWLTIRTSTPDSALPAANARISPAYASLLPNLVAPGFNQPVVQTAPGANHYILLGLECLPTNPQAVVSTLVTLGDGSSAQNSLDQVPHDLVLDRCYIHGLSGVELKRGIGLNSASTQILNCYISDCKGVGYDTQAICGWNGPGPFTITNNYLEGAGENVMFGGSDPAILGLIPSDITITNNTFFKPLSWRMGDPTYAGAHWSIKNLFEIKNAQRVTIDSNLFQNSWADGQVGFAISLKSANQSGSAIWSTCSDVQFTNNIVRHAACGVNIAGDSGTYASTQAQRIAISNNLFDDINGTTWGGAGAFLQATDSDSLTVNHNTVIQTGNIYAAYGVPVTNFVFTNNIVAHNTYGVKGDSLSSGTATMAQFLPTCVFQNNVVAGQPQEALFYPAGNFWPATWTDAGFTDFANANYVLADTSPYNNAATDGTDMGCVFVNATTCTFALGSTTLAGGSAGGIGTVTFNGAAPPGSPPIMVTCSDPTVAFVPAIVTVNPGVTYVTFPITAPPTSGNKRVTITASWSGLIRSSTLSIVPLFRYLNTASNVTGGNASPATVFLNGPAPAGGVTVTLSSSNAVASVPATVVVPAGASSVTFPIATSFVTSDVKATISAGYAGTTSTSSLTTHTLAFTYVKVNLANAQLIGGASCIGSVTINAPAPAGGTAVSLSSSNAACGVPATVVIPQGAMVASFTLTSRAVSANTAIVITGTYNGVVHTSSLTITP